MLSDLALIAPIGIAAYLASSKDDTSVNLRKMDNKSGSWLSDNTWVYLENPLNAPKIIPGDHFEYDLESPAGPVQRSMMNESDPVKALNILGQHERERDLSVQQVWVEFVKPKTELQTRSVDQPITQVNILQPGGIVDQTVKTGNRFWDAPVPRWTGIDNWYKRKETVPFYLVPNP